MARKEAVVSIVELGNEVLVVKKVDDGGKSLMSGKWHLPGETKKEGETDEMAVQRGVLEETGVIVAGAVYLTSSESPKGTLLKWYKCTALTRPIIPGDDAVDGQWAGIENVAYVCAEEAVAMWPQAIREYFRLIN